MRKLLIFLLLLTILMTSASAENVTVQIFENSDGVYFIEIGNSELIECGDSCTVNVENITSESTTLTKEDIERIGKQVSVELHGQEEMFNTSEHYSITSDIVKGADADLMEWLKKNYMPTVEEFNNLTLELSEKQAALDVLDAKFATFDQQIKSYDREVETYQRNEYVLIAFILLFAFGLGFVLIIRSSYIVAWQERRRQ